LIRVLSSSEVYRVDMLIYSLAGFAFLTCGESGAVDETPAYRMAAGVHWWGSYSPNL
jgi:hypothetical protein